MLRVSRHPCRCAAPSVRKAAVQGVSVCLLEGLQCRPGPTQGTCGTRCRAPSTIRCSITSPTPQSGRAPPRAPPPADRPGRRPRLRTSPAPSTCDGPAGAAAPTAAASPPGAGAQEHPRRGSARHRAGIVTATGRCSLNRGRRRLSVGIDQDVRQILPARPIACLRQRTCCCYRAWRGSPWVRSPPPGSCTQFSARQRRAVPHTEHPAESNTDTKCAVAPIAAAVAPQLSERRASIVEAFGVLLHSSLPHAGERQH